MRVQAFATMQNSDITTSLAAEAIKALKSSHGSTQVSILQIQEEVAKYYHIHVNDLKGKNGSKASWSHGRSRCISRELTDSSLPKIGGEFGGKDHTTVIHAHEKFSI